MIYTTEMIQLFAVVLAKDRDRVTEALLREGVMQFIGISELQSKSTPASWSAAASESSLSEVSELRKRVEGLLHTISIIPTSPQETDLNRRTVIDLEKGKSHIDRIDKEREAIRERQRIIQQEILKLEDIRRQVELYGVGVSEVELPAQHSLLTMQAGRLPTANLQQLEESLKNLPALKLLLNQENDIGYHLLLFMKRDSEQIEKILAAAGWINVKLPSEQLSVQKNLCDEVMEKLKHLNQEQKKLHNELMDLIKREEKKLRELWTNLRINELCCKIQVHFETSARTVLFAGWLPAAKKQTLTEAIGKTCQGRCYLEWYEPGSKEVIGDEVPVQFNNPPVLSPFQMLVSNFGVPQYGTIDPTPVVMPLYLIMFGLMFADVGQGFVLLILSLLGMHWFKKKDDKKGLYQLSWLLAWCGISSIVFGALFGSYFGMAWAQPLWFNFHGIVSGHSSGNPMIKDVFDVLGITIYFGIVVISIGLIFNWINIIRTKQWIELLFDKGGLLGGWIYAGGIYIAFYAMGRDYKEFPPAAVLFLLAGLPSLVFFFKAPYFHAREHKEAGEKHSGFLANLPIFLLEWMVELLEVFCGFLSNTLSFMRVAGLGIAHACLMISFFALAEMTHNTVAGILILILGNILVISLEGLSAGIQALRLHYYEFFTKFFHGTGKLHTPISLRSEL